MFSTYVSGGGENSLLNDSRLFLGEFDLHKEGALDPDNTKPLVDGETSRTPRTPEQVSASRCVTEAESMDSFPSSSAVKSEKSMTAFRSLTYNLGLSKEDGADDASCEDKPDNAITSFFSALTFTNSAAQLEPMDQGISNGCVPVDTHARGHHEEIDDSGAPPLPQCDVRTAGGTLLSAQKPATAMQATTNDETLYETALVSTAARKASVLDCELSDGGKHGDDLILGVHPDVECVRCRQLPLRGIRYKAKFMANYDLCRKCLETHKQRLPEYPTDDFDTTHYTRITPPLAAHATVSCALCECSPIYGTRYKAKNPTSIPPRHEDPLADASNSTKWVSEPHDHAALSSADARSVPPCFGDICGKCMARTRNNCVPVEFYAIPQELVHTCAARCAGCNKGPIIGVRYAHKWISGYDLCERCIVENPKGGEFMPVTREMTLEQIVSSHSVVGRIMEFVTALCR